MNMKEETKKYIKKELSSIIKKSREPNVNPRQLAIFIGIVIWLITSNSSLFGGTLLSIAITIVSYFVILALRGKIGGGYAQLLKTVFEVMSNGATDLDKIDKLENVLIMSANLLGDAYEKQLEKLITYMKQKKAIK